MRLTFSFLLSVLLAATIQVRPAFEVAAVKPIGPGRGTPSIEISPGGRFNATDVTLKRLIRWAYKVEDFQIVGGPLWMATDKWSVMAKREDAANNEQMPEMLQALLEERFKLKWSRPTRETDVYALVVGKDGSKLQESDKGGEGPSHAILKPPCMAELTFPFGATMTQLANFLSGQQGIGRPVIDQTGLTGVYDFRLSWTPIGGLSLVDGGFESGGMPPPPPPPSPGSPCPPPTPIAAALREQIGLELQATKTPVTMLVVDSVEKPDR